MKSKDRLSTNVPGVPLDDKNLIIKALNLYRKKTGFTLIRKCLLVLGLAVEVVMLRLHYGPQISSVVVLPLKRSFRNGQVVEDIPPPIPLDMPMVLIKPQQHLRLDQSSSVDPLTLLEKIAQMGISQDVCINDLEPPAFEVLPSLKLLKKRVLAAGCGQYDSVFMSGSGSTIIGIGSPEPPQFVYDDDEYKDAFVSEARFLTRRENQWYTKLNSTTSSFESPSDLSPTVE